MPTVYLIRHAAHGLLGRVLTGRMADVHLSDEGRAQSEHLAGALAAERIGSIYCSPMERARQTAAPIAARLGLDVEVADALNEIDMGEWSGRTFDELHRDARWRDYNTFRSGTRPPGGETMLEAQARMVAFMEQLRDSSDGRETDSIALVSHGDPIKAALLYWLGAPLDLHSRLEIAPASISVIELEKWGARVKAINRSG